MSIGSDSRSRGWSLTDSPTLQTLAVILAVFVVSRLFVFVDVAFRLLFVLNTPVLLQPWAVVTSVYAHADLAHLLSNGIVLLVAGLILERSTTSRAFHAYFLTTGALAGLAHVWLRGLVGAPSGVLGASGAIFALVGYLLTANRASQGAFDALGLSDRAQVGLLAAFAVVVTVATAGPGVSLIGHFVGLLLGLLAGWVNLLPSADGRRSRRDRDSPRR